MLFTILPGESKKKSDIHHLVGIWTEAGYSPKANISTQYF